jgi:hypothetical protein
MVMSARSRIRGAKRNPNIAPTLQGSLELGRHHAHQDRRRLVFSCQNDARVAHVAKLNRESEPVRRPAMLAGE